MIKYSSKSVVVTGDTKPYRGHFKKLGGKFNPHLRKPGDDDERYQGWIFSARREDKVKELIEKIESGSLE